MKKRPENYRTILACLAFCIVLPLSSQANKSATDIAGILQSSGIQIEVYTTQYYPIQHTADFPLVPIYYVDAVEQAEERFAESMPLSTDPVTAEHQIQTLEHVSTFQAYENNLKDAYIGVIKGWQNGIRKVPAIVFTQQNTSAVIYGEQNIDSAARRYLQAKGVIYDQ